MNEKLFQARQGVTVTITAEELICNTLEEFELYPVFICLADVQAWCTTFGLTFTDNNDNTFTISKP